MGIVYGVRGVRYVTILTGNLRAARCRFIFSGRDLEVSLEITAEFVVCGVWGELLRGNRGGVGEKIISFLRWYDLAAKLYLVDGYYGICVYLRCRDLVSLCAWKYSRTARWVSSLRTFVHSPFISMYKILVFSEPKLHGKYKFSVLQFENLDTIVEYSGVLCGWGTPLRSARFQLWSGFASLTSRNVSDCLFVYAFISAGAEAPGSPMTLIEVILTLDRKLWRMPEKWGEFFCWGHGCACGLPDLTVCGAESPRRRSSLYTL